MIGNNSLYYCKIITTQYTTLLKFSSGHSENKPAIFGFSLETVMTPHIDNI